jgi:hypothetical protein
VYQQQQQQEEQQDAKNPFLDPPFSRIKNIYPFLCSDGFFLNKAPKLFVFD